MDTVKLKVDQVTAVPFRNLNLVEGEGYVMSEQRGKIYLEPGKEMCRTVLHFFRRFPLTVMQENILVENS